jgi:hypothetical protein
MLGDQGKEKWKRRRRSYGHFFKRNKGWRCSLVIKHFFSMSKALGLILRTTKRKQKELTL